MIIFPALNESNPIRIGTSKLFLASVLVHGIVASCTRDRMARNRSATKCHWANIVPKPQQQENGVSFKTRHDVCMRRMRVWKDIGHALCPWAESWKSTNHMFDRDSLGLLHKRSMKQRHTTSSIWILQLSRPPTRKNLVHSLLISTSTELPASHSTSC